MIFKNARLFGFDAKRLQSIEIDARLAKAGLEGLTALERVRAGFVAASEEGTLVFDRRDHALLMMAIDKKILPPGVVRQTAEGRVAKLEQTRGRALSRKMKAEVREEVELELLARAFSMQHRYRICLDRQTGLGFVDASSAKIVECFFDLWRAVLPEVALRPIETAVSTLTAMTQWVAKGQAPNNLTIDQEAELRSAAAGQATVRYVRHPLEEAEMRKHVVNGKQCTRLALTWANRVSFVLYEDLSLRRLQWIDTNPLESAGESSEAERFEADFAIASGDLSHLLTDLIVALGGFNA